TGFGITSLVAATNTFLQLEAEDSLRGRLMSLFSVVFLGFAPIGNLAAGGIAHHIGAPHTVLLSALICLLGTAGLGYGLCRSALAPRARLERPVRLFLSQRIAKKRGTRRESIRVAMRGVFVT